MIMIREKLPLYFIMGSNNTGANPAAVLREAIRGGVTCFQFREKGSGALSGSAKESLARELQDICHSYNIPFIVNDDLELAIRLQADGIHMGQKDTPLREFKHDIPSNMITGISTKTWEEAQEAQKDGADYLGVGPMFSTTTKEDADKPVGPETIQMMRNYGISLPIVGIGGINASNATDVIRAGADGISLISAISQSEDPESTARLLRHALIEN